MPEIALNPPPFNPVWEKGGGGMRGKRRGNAANRASRPRTLPVRTPPSAARSRRASPLGARTSCPRPPPQPAFPSRHTPGSARVLPASPAASPLTGADVLASPCVPSPASAIRTPKLPLLPVWEKGAGGMRGKGAQECRTSLIFPKNSTLESRGQEGCSQEQMFWQAPACHLPLQPSERPNSPFSPCGRRGSGG
jgi:hypothetical protein